MKKKVFRFVLRLLLLFFLVFTAVSWDRDLITHLGGGIAVAFCSGGHLYANKKQLALIPKIFQKDALAPKLKRQYLIDFLLLVFWAVVLISGLINYSYVIAGDDLSGFHLVHGLSVRLGGLLTLLHVVGRRRRLGFS